MAAPGRAAAEAQSTVALGSCRRAVSLTVSLRRVYTRVSSYTSSPEPRGGQDPNDASVVGYQARVS